MVTSSVPGEGKSFVAMQLWKMMAEVGIPVLLVDCDFRNSRLWHRYGISAAPGEDLVGPPIIWRGGQNCGMWCTKPISPMAT